MPAHRGPWPGLALACLVLPAGAALAGIVVEERPSGAIRQELRGAFTQFDADVRRNSSSSLSPADLGAKGIIIINSRTGRLASPGAKKGFNPQPEPPGRTRLKRPPSPGAAKGFNPQPEPPGRDRGIIVVGGLPQGTLSRLQRAAQTFERAAGPSSPKVKSCKTRESRCMSQCRTAMRQMQLNGRCVCTGVLAHCLNSIRFQPDRLKKHPPDPVRPSAGTKSPLDRGSKLAAPPPKKVAGGVRIAPGMRHPVATLNIRRYSQGITTISEPRIDGMRLDWCMSLGKDCGLPVIGAYCQKMGYTSAGLLFHVEATLQPSNRESVYQTRTLSGQTCTNPPARCDAFRKITCATFTLGIFAWDAPADEGTIIAASGHRLDFCREWSQNCGKPAADEFCRARGFKRAKSFVPWQDVPFPTATIGGDHKICDKTIAPRCDSFRSVTCE